jgi:putative iron-dependent peroxidase
VTELMLERMFIGDPPGNYDRILDFSTAVTGNLFFVPPAGFLDDLPDPPATPATSGAEAATPSPSTSPSAPAADGSLGIGGLKRSSQP